MSVPQSPTAPKVAAETKVDTKSTPVSEVRKRRSDKIGYDKKNAFKKTFNGKEITTPVLLKRPKETEEQFLERMTTGGWLGPDKPKGHWAPDNPMLYHMGVKPEDCPYCSGRREVTARKKKSAPKLKFSGQKLHVERLGTATPSKDGGRIYFFFNQADFIKISKVQASDVTVLLTTAKFGNSASGQSSVPPAKLEDKQEKKEPEIKSAPDDKLSAAIRDAKPPEKSVISSSLAGKRITDS